MERQAHAPGIRGAGSALQAWHYDIFVDGSTEHRVAIGAAAVASTGNSCRVRRRGFFVGPAASELLGVMLGYRVYQFLLNDLEHDQRDSRSATLHIDSDICIKYMNGFTPSKAAGRKLMPLIDLVREEQRRHPQVTWTKCTSAESRADSLAYTAMCEARDQSIVDGPDETGSALFAAVCEVETRTRAVHL